MTMRMQTTAFTPVIYTAQVYHLRHREFLTLLFKVQKKTPSPRFRAKVIMKSARREFRDRICYAGIEVEIDTD
jgi:hypothetical protein